MWVHASTCDEFENRVLQVAALHRLDIRAPAPPGCAAVVVLDGTSIAVWDASMGLGAGWGMICTSLDPPPAAWTDDVVWVGPLTSQEQAELAKKVGLET